MEQQKHETENQVDFEKVKTGAYRDGKKLDPNTPGATDSDNMEQASVTEHRHSWMDEDTSEIQPNPPKPEKSQTSTTNTRPAWMDEDTSEIQPNPPKAVVKKTSTVQTLTSWMDEDTSEIQPNPPKIMSCQNRGMKNPLVWMDDVTSDVMPKPPKIAEEEQLCETELGTPGKKKEKPDLPKKPKVFIFKRIDDMFSHLMRMAIKWFVNCFCDRK